MSESEEKKDKKFRSLTVSLAVAFSVLTIFLLIIAGGFQAYFSLQAQQKDLANNLTLVANGAADTVNNFIQGKFDILAATVRLGDLTTGSYEKQDATLDKLLGVEPAFRQLVLFDLQQQELLRVSRISKSLSTELMKYDQGEIFSKTNQKESYLSSSVYIDELTSEPMAIMAVPVIDVFGDIKGTLVAEVNLKFMWDLVGGMTIGDSGLAYVVDRRGNLIAFQDIGRVLKGENLANLKEVREFIQSDGTSRGSTDGLGISQGIQKTDVVSTYLSLGLADWAVVIELPAREAYRSVTQLSLLSALIAFLSFAIALLAGILLSRKIARPIIKLRDVAIEISKGKLDTKIEVQTKDEIGQLADSFNSMTAQLAKSIRELQEERARLVASIDSLPLGFAIVDQKGEFIIANPVLMGLFPSQGKNFSFNYVSAQLLDKTGKRVDLDVERKRALQKEEPVEFKNLFLDDKSIRVFISPILLEQGDKYEAIGTVFLVEDTTEQKLLEEAKNSFVAITAHELRTPLTIIRGNAELISTLLPKELPNPQIKEMVDAIERSGIRLLDIVNDFLDLTALEEHKMRFKSEQFDLVKLVNETVSDFQGRAAKKSLFLKIIPPDEHMSEIIADQERTKEVVVNIIGNAIQYTDEGGITLSFEEKNGLIELSIKDTGIGIEPDKQKYLFQKFQTVSGRFLHSREYGSGMGLYISKLATESMGSTIRLEESKLGVGSTFTITFPKADSKGRLSNG